MERVKRVILADYAPEDQAEALYLKQRRAFGRFDAILDKADYGPLWLNRPEIAQEVMDSLHFLDGDQFDLDVYCVMSNHVHVVLTPLENDKGQISLSRIMHSHKRFTAAEANKILGRQGQFWRRESYDHVVRDEDELRRIRQYLLNNPVKAGLVDNAEIWPYSWASWLD